MTGQQSKSPEEDWASYSRLVLSKLDDHTTWLQELTKQLNKQNIQIAKLQVRSSLWGGVAGSIAGLIAAVAALLIKWKSGG